MSLKRLPRRRGSPPDFRPGDYIGWLWWDDRERYNWLRNRLADKKLLSEQLALRMTGAGDVQLSILFNVADPVRNPSYVIDVFDRLRSAPSRGGEVELAWLVALLLRYRAWARVDGFNRDEWPTGLDGFEKNCDNRTHALECFYEAFLAKNVDEMQRNALAYCALSAFANGYRRMVAKMVTTRRAGQSKTTPALRRDVLLFWHGAALVRMPAGEVFRSSLIDKDFLLAFANLHERETGRYHGWKQAAARELNVSRAQIDQRIKPAAPVP